TGLLLSTLTMQKLMMNKGLAGNISSDLLERIESDVLAENPDLVLLMVGTNDMLNSMKMTSYAEYSSRLTEIVRSLKKSKIELLLLSPPTVDSAYLFERHDRSLFREGPNQKLDSISRIMEHVSIREEVGFLDINKCFRVLHLPEHNLDSYIQNEKNSGKRDGVHLTAYGNSFLARMILDYFAHKKN
ncbi:MAG: GDSL-type esterase/lipase family protein, partial [Bacteroides sp.]|nr:GDSL-type esterase/lipase family protein [Bacteroides sp.]